MTKLKNISIHIQSKKLKEVFNKVTVTHACLSNCFKHCLSKKGSPEEFPIYAPVIPIRVDLDRIKWTRSEIDHESQWPDFMTGFHFRVLGSKTLNCKQGDELRSEIRNLLFCYRGIFRRCIWWRV